MRPILLILWILVEIGLCEDFLDIPLEELCASEPTLRACRGANPSRDSEILRSNKKSHQQGFVEQKEGEDPFEEIVTRAPPNSRRPEDDEDDRITLHHHTRKGHKKGRGHMSRREYNARLQEYYRKQEFRKNYQRGLYNMYPNLYPKDQNYCETMKPNYAFHCQPGKSLRIDLVEFCKDYSVFCHIPNFHRLPGPREGPSTGKGGPGHVGVAGEFGLGVGSVPGLEVSAGWGVDVGPIPGMTESVGVDLGLNLGLVGSKSPEAYRRGMDNPNEKGGGVFGISGGVGVKAPGTDQIGVGTGLGVGK